MRMRKGVKMQKTDESVFIAEGARVIGDVTIGKDSSVWFNAVLRGDEDRIIIGERSNIQDNCVIHCGQGYSTVVGNGVTVGHLALLHGCTIGDNTLIGMHSTVMNGAKIGKNCVIGAASLVTAGTVIPDNSMALGSPAKVIRSVREEEIGYNKFDADFYCRRAALYMEWEKNGGDGSKSMR